MNELTPLVIKLKSLTAAKRFATRKERKSFEKNIGKIKKEINKIHAERTDESLLKL